MERDRDPSSAERVGQSATQTPGRRVSAVLSPRNEGGLQTRLGQRVSECEDKHEISYG